MSCCPGYASLVSPRSDRNLAIYDTDSTGPLDLFTYTHHQQSSFSGFLPGKFVWNFLRYQSCSLNKYTYKLGTSVSLETNIYNNYSIKYSLGLKLYVLTVESFKRKTGIC